MINLTNIPKDLVPNWSIDKIETEEKPEGFINARIYASNKGRKAIAEVHVNKENLNETNWPLMVQRALWRCEKKLK